MDDDVRLLIVDDSPDFLLAMASALEANGYRVRTAPDGRDALVVIDEFKPHCVLFDIDMPNLDGTELSRRLRERFGDDVVLIAMTGRAPTEPRVAETFERADHYLIKPITLDVLKKCLPPVGTAAAPPPARGLDEAGD